MSGRQKSGMTGIVLCVDISPFLNQYLGYFIMISITGKYKSGITIRLWLINNRDNILIASFNQMFEFRLVTELST